MSWWQVGFVANAVVSMSYLAIAFSVIRPLRRAGELFVNRLGTATGAIFFSCSVGHGMHAIGGLNAGLSGAGHHAFGSVTPWHAVLWDLTTAMIGVYYWSLRRSYGALLQGAALFDTLEQQRRVAELDSQTAISAARAAAEQERDAHAAMLSSVIANSQTLIAVKDLEGRFLLANTSLERLFGVGKGELVGRTDDYLDADLAPAWRHNDLRAQEGLLEVIEWCEAADGQHCFEAVKFPLHDAQGRLYATCGVSMDITERLRTQAIERSRDEALLATAAKSAFLATMSHEIRTPMNAVIGMTGLLGRTELDAHQRELVEGLRGSGSALLAVINNVLDFSKLEAGDLGLEQRPFRLCPIVEASLDMLIATVGDRDLDLISYIAQDCPSSVIGDPTRLSQVLVNLVTNAVKFTERGHVLVTVDAIPSGVGESTITITVTDTGIGIPQQALGSLFESFTQVDASTTRVYGGTGLGLAISQRLVAAMGSELRVTSTEGVGSSFSFALSMRHGPDVTDPVLSVLQHEELAGRRVLILDDNGTNRAILALHAEGWGMHCAHAESQAAALDLLASGAAYDVAIVDTTMFGASCHDSLRELRAQPAIAGLPMVGLTSLQCGAATEGIGAAVTVLTRPVKRQALCAALRDVLNPGSRLPLATKIADGTGSARHRRPLRILLAEDDVVNQKLGQWMLRGLGHEVDTVATGRDAVAAVTETGYDAVFMDVHMPEMDGLQATRAIRSTVPEQRQPHIVGLTASVVDDEVVCTRAGMNQYLLKPVTEEDLAVALTMLTSDDASLGIGQAAAGEVEASEDGGGGSPDGLDRAVLARLTEGLGARGPEVLARVVEAYLQSGAGWLATLTAAARTHDAATLQLVAPAMRETSGLLGLSPLVAALSEMEIASRGSAVQREAALAGVLSEYRRMSAELISIAGTGPVAVPGSVRVG